MFVCAYGYAYVSICVGRGVSVCPVCPCVSSCVNMGMHMHLSVLVGVCPCVRVCLRVCLCVFVCARGAARVYGVWTCVWGVDVAFISSHCLGVMGTRP
jgi:hypothetical protein